MLKSTAGGGGSDKYQLWMMMMAMTIAMTWYVSETVDLRVSEYYVKPLNKGKTTAIYVTSFLQGSHFIYSTFSFIM